MGKMLLLRYDGAFPPQDWETMGGVREDEVVWKFASADEEASVRLIDALATATSPQVMRETLALEFSVDGPFPSMATFLRNARGLDSLVTRKRYAWLLDSLDSRVRIYLHPIVDMMSGAQIYAYEALCRLIEPSGNILNGAQSFALAQTAGRVADLDVACQRRALERKASEFPKGVALFLNVLPQNLLQQPWRAMLLDTLEQLGIPPYELVVEVVESEQADVAELASACDDLRRGGVRIALDDIGAGFNGLSTLAAVRADFIKIDRALVHQAQRSRVRTVLLEAIVSMAQRLGTKVIAEGLERPEDILFCREMAIGYAQGFYFAYPAENLTGEVKPMPAPSSLLRARPSPKLDLAQFMEAGAAIDVSETLEHAQARFQAMPSLTSLVVVDSGYPIGVLPRGAAMTAGHGGLGKLCRPLAQVLPNEISSHLLARRLLVHGQSPEAWIVVAPDGQYLGEVAPANLLASLISRRDGAVDIHPLTQLPTGPGLRHSLESRLESGEPCTLVYVDLDHFKAYNDRYGFVRGDAMIRVLSELLRAAFQDRPDTQLGHIGGDDFVLIVTGDSATPLDLLQKVVTQFHAIALHLYDEADLRRGYFVTEDALSHPIANVSIAVVNGSTGRPASAVVAAERAAALKKLAKSRDGCMMVVEGAPPSIEAIDIALCLGLWEHNAIESLGNLTLRPRGGDPHLLDAAFKDFPYFEVVFELDAEGIQRHPNWINPDMYGRIKAGGQGMDRSYQAYFRKAREGKLSYVSPIYLSNATEDFCLTISVPIVRDGVFEGVLVADTNLTSLAEWSLREG